MNGGKIRKLWLDRHLSGMTADQTLREMQTEFYASVLDFLGWLRDTIDLEIKKEHE